jgi:hypothetical protein
MGKPGQQVGAMYYGWLLNGYQQLRMDKNMLLVDVCVLFSFM